MLNQPNNLKPMSHFFGPLRDIIDNLQKLTPEVLVFNALDRNPEIQKRILDLVRIEQLFKRGISGDGTDLNTMTQSGFGYAASTKASKRRKGQPTGHVTLFDTGQFYKSFRLILNRQSFHIEADGQKDTSNLFDDFGTSIVDLTDESIDRLVEMLIPILPNEIRRAL